MEYLEMDLSVLPRVLLFNQETLTSATSHKSRTAQEYILYYILSGELHLADNKKEITLKEGDLYLFFKGEYHCPVRSTNCKYLYIHFDGDFYKKRADNIEELIKSKHNSFIINSYTSPDFDTVLFLPKFYHVNSPALHKTIMTSFGKYRLGSVIAKEDFYRTVTELKITELFIEIYRCFANDIAYNAQTPGENLVNTVANYISKNYSRKITGTELQKLFGYNFDYMNRCFKSATGKTVFGFLQEERIKNAENLLKLKNISVSQVAKECGFCDVYYFSKTFKKFTGLSPKNYMQGKSG